MGRAGFDEDHVWRSEGPALSSVEDMAAWLLKLMDAAGVQQAVLAGHSMGSLVALEAAGLAPERVARLLMLGTAYPMKVSSALLETSLTAPLQAIDRVVAWSFSTLAAKPSYPGPGVWLRGGAQALMRLVLSGQGDSRLFHTDFSACDAYAGGELAASKVRCPVHLVLGTADQMTPPKAAAALALSGLNAELQSFDRSLASTVETSRRKIEYQFGKITRKTGAHMLARDEQAARDSRALSGLVFPERHLQERLYSIVPFLAKFGPGLVAELYDQVHVECPDHQFVTL